ncbi:MAG TPA: WS/DGAT domain-containing protein [Rhodothermales bacterium]|nr:WS/DGAT domain-containing protein [Rhodothermales bacterium]
MKNPELVHMRGEDGVWLQDTPDNPMIINAVLLFDRLRLADFMEVWDKNVMQVTDQATGQMQYHRFKKRVVYQQGRFYWQEDPCFEINNHIFAVEDPEIRNEDDLALYLGREASKLLPKERPLWQLHFFEKIGDGSALVVRIHHCMGDGVALIPILFSLIDEVSGSPSDLEKVSKPQIPVWIRFGIVPLTAIPVLLRRLCWIPDRSILHGPKMNGEKRFGWTAPISMIDVKALKNAMGATVNDVLMACVAGAFSRYLQLKGQTVPTKVRTSMPVNLRTTGEQIRMENQFSIAFLELPLHPADPIARAKKVKQGLDRFKRSLQPFIMLKAAAIVSNILPTNIARFVLNLFANKTTAVTTNVPGPQEDLHLAGQRVRSMMFWVPTRARIGMGISILSMSGAVRVGIMGDTAILADPEAFANGFIAEFEHLRAHYLKK